MLFYILENVEFTLFRFICSYESQFRDDFFYIIQITWLRNCISLIWLLLTEWYKTNLDRIARLSLMRLSP